MGHTIPTACFLYHDELHAFFFFATLPLTLHLNNFSFFGDVPLGISSNEKRNNQYITNKFINKYLK